MTLALDAATMKEIKLHPEIRWSEVARQAFQRKISELHAIDAAFANSKLTMKDVEKLSKQAKERMLKDLGW